MESSDANSFSVLEQYGRFYDGSSAFFITASPHDPCPDTATRKISYAIRPELGRGWTDIHEFENGVVLGRMDCFMTRAVTDACQTFPDNICIGIMVSGESRTMLASGQSVIAAPGDLMLRNANPGMVVRTIGANSPSSGVSIDIPRRMFETMQEQGVDLSCIGRSDAYATIRQSASTTTALLALGQRILALPSNTSLLAHIELESLGLDLLLKLVSACSAPGPGRDGHAARRWQTALDDALDILHAEWNQSLSIAQLARRAGINECYLKTLFRERTGQSIAEYLRNLRMMHARTMLESGQYTVQQIARHCGYVHAGKFAQAFRRVHGLAPSEVR